MKKQLFFDDNLLFGRDNVRRIYGEPELLATYHDGVSSTDFATGYVFRLADGRYRMLYFGHSAAYAGKKLLAAISVDGVHFAPEPLYPDKPLPHEVLSLPEGTEVATVYEDTRCGNPAERYKMLLAEHDMNELAVADRVYVSGDLLTWVCKPESVWGDGTEPLAGVFYNAHAGVYTVLCRPFWGVRCAGYRETADWVDFTPHRLCLNVDSEEERLAEIYGMPTVLPYAGMYVGVPHLYRGLDSQRNAKYLGGVIDTQLAYSYDGRYWRRSLRRPFLSYAAGEPRYPMVWLMQLLEAEDGSLLLYGSASGKEHGPAFGQPGEGVILIHRLRQDGFIALQSTDPAVPATVTTREKVWHGGELHLNLQAAEATVAVYLSGGDAHTGYNVLGFSEPVEGYGHGDCVPFAGDTTDWTPVWRDGKTLAALAGQTLVFELEFRDGAVYSLSGDYTDLFNTQAARYRKYGELPASPAEP